MILIPATSSVFLVTRVRSCTTAVAAIRVSITGQVRSAANSPQRWSTAASTGMTLSANFCSIPSTQSAIRVAVPGSARRLISTPFLSSPKVSALMNRLDSGQRSKKFKTYGSGPDFLVSETTFVSSKYRARTIKS